MVGKDQVLMDPKDAAQLITMRLKRPKGAFTISDICAQSGLSIANAKAGLTHLTYAFRGHLGATSQGELIYTFPYGFSKPWEKVEWLDRAWQKFKSTMLGVAKFVVRAWLSIVLIVYVAVFAAILIALTFSQKSDDRDRDSSGPSLMMHALLRLVSDALFWTFHPFSPFRMGANPYDRRPKSGVPFYEKVNRFFFGMQPAPQDPLAMQQKLIALIRAKSGRIGIFDVMRVTGWPKAKADPVLAKLMLDFDGEVSVSDEGGIVYTFKDVRKTAQVATNVEPEPIWNKVEKLLPLTGNSAETNLMIAGLNGFNWFMSTMAIANAWTFENLGLILNGAKAHGPMVLTGTPIVLGWVPFWFSTMLFALPLIRLFYRSKAKRKIAKENGRRGLLWAVLNRLDAKGIPEETLRDAYKSRAGIAPSDRELLREIVLLGGELTVNEAGQHWYQFVDLELERSALIKARQAASGQETGVGDLVFSSSS